MIVLLVPGSELTCERCELARCCRLPIARLPIADCLGAGLFYVCTFCAFDVPYEQLTPYGRKIESNNKRPLVERIVCI